MVNLDAGVADPNKRTGFRHAMLESWILNERGRLIAALLTLARHWVCQECPADPDLKLGGFEGWARVVGGVLYASGIPRLSGAVAAAEHCNTEGEQDTLFVAAWLDRLRDNDAAMTPGELAQLAIDNGLYEAALKGVSNPNWFARRMSEHVLNRLRDRIIPVDGKGYRIAVVGERSRQKLFGLIPEEE